MKNDRVPNFDVFVHHGFIDQKKMNIIEPENNNRRFVIAYFIIILSFI